MLAIVWFWTNFKKLLNSCCYILRSSETKIELYTQEMRRNTQEEHQKLAETHKKQAKNKCAKQKFLVTVGKTNMPIWDKKMSLSFACYVANKRKWKKNLKKTET